MRKMRSAGVASRRYPARLGLATPCSRKLTCQIPGPAAVPARMHVHPHPALPFVELERSGPTGDPEMPMPAAGAPGQLAFASDDETSLSAFIEGLPRCQLEIEDQHLTGAFRSRTC